MKRIAPLLALVLLAAPCWAQNVELYESRAYVKGEAEVYVRGGVVPSKALEIWAEGSRPGPGVRVEVVYSLDGFQTSARAPAELVHTNAGPSGERAVWKAEIGAQPNAKTFEYYVEARAPNAPTVGLNGGGFNGNAGENFVLYVWNGPRAPAPAQPGQVTEVRLEDIRSSQGWLFRSRGYYDPAQVQNGSPKIPIVYWVGWAERPYWALANDGNHRTFDAIRRGLERIQVQVVEPPYHLFPARYKFYDQPVFADADVEKRHPIGKARDFHGVDAQAQPFARTRRGTGPVQPLSFSAAEVAEVFREVRRGALTLVGERHAAAPPSAREGLRAVLAELEGSRLRLLETNDLTAERAGREVRLSTGLLNELARRAGSGPDAPQARARSLALVIAHELSHLTGIRGERIADATALEILRRTEGVRTGPRRAVPLQPQDIRAAVEAFDRPSGVRTLDATIGRLRDRLSHGSSQERIAALEAMAEGRWADQLRAYRRADGTLNWQRLGRDRTLREAGGLVHFGLALFLKELAVVAQTGDQARIEEFFDGLMTTDFYKHYGLFVLGARAGEVAYGRYLQRYVKPQFVNGVLKTNLVLAAGLALPQLVDGTFEGKLFEISLTSLGLSSAAVKTGVASIKWVKDLASARRATSAASLARASRLARLGGWFYTAGELAVVLYLAEQVEERVHAYLDRRRATGAFADAAQALGQELARARTPAQVEAAAERFHEEAVAYRDGLYAPLLASEARFQQRLEKLAREAKLAADERAAAEERVARLPALRARLVAQHGSLEAWLAAREAEDTRQLQAEIDEASGRYAAEREALMSEVYRGNQREAPLLAEVEHLDWLAGGGAAGGADDPYGARDDLWSRIGRRRLTASYEGALREVSRNRLEAYEDERAVLLASAEGLDPARAAPLLALAERLQRVRAVDEELFTSEGFPQLQRAGAADAVRPR